MQLSVFHPVPCVVLEARRRCVGEVGVRLQTLSHPSSDTRSVLGMLYKFALFCVHSIILYFTLCSLGPKFRVCTLNILTECEFNL